MVDQLFAVARDRGDYPQARTPIYSRLSLLILLPLCPWGTASATAIHQWGGDSPSFLLAMGVFLPVVFTFIYWNRRLKAEISQRRAAEQQWLRSSENLAIAQSISHIGSWEWDIASGKLTWSDEIYRIFGMEPQSCEATYSAFLEAIHPNDRALVEGEVNKAVADPNHPYRVEHRIVRTDGETRWVVELGTIQRDPQCGTPQLMRGTVQDITDLHKAADSLQLAHQVIANTSEAVLITDAFKRIIDVNPAYERSTGYSREEVLGKSPAITSSGRHGPDFYREMWRQINSSDHWSGEVWDRRKNGEVFPQVLTINAIRDFDGKVVNYVGILKDITAQKATEDMLEKLAFYDPLTSLPNRALFKDRLEHDLVHADRNGDRVGLFFLDLDRFKYVNDTLGHNAGDLLLQQVAQRLEECVRSSDTICRIGGDEFTIVLSDIEQINDISTIAAKIIERLEQAFVLKGSEVFVGASIGIALYPDDAASFEELTKNADLAMYQAKEAGRGVYRYFTADMNSANLRRLSLEGDLRKALDQQQLTLFYQPKVAVESGRIVGMEALVRWIHPEKGMISPIDFIPLAEETGLILPLGSQVLEQACMQTRKWTLEGLGELKVAVNLSARQFQDSGLIALVRDTLRRSGLPPAQLELELTETAVMADVDEAIAQITALREVGVHISIDDFGTGYSSLS
ncbi:MAG: diguanylate cyclase, partial [Gammaproteobacteria bacterium]|nr:diguanylate cyclase [Gammaproteobacteria bacterium]